jgi:hypothetical protein
MLNVRGRGQNIRKFRAHMSVVHAEQKPAHFLAKPAEWGTTDSKIHDEGNLQPGVDGACAADISRPSIRSIHGHKSQGRRELRMPPPRKMAQQPTAYLSRNEGYSKGVTQNAAEPNHGLLTHDTGVSPVYCAITLSLRQTRDNTHENTP